jgi:hypothetical protein
MVRFSRICYEYILSYLTSYNIRLGLSQSANSKVFLRNTHHLSRLGKLLGRLIDGVECHLPSSPVHSNSLLCVLSSAWDPFWSAETYEILEHPDSVDGCIVDRRHLEPGSIRADGNKSEIEWSQSLADLLERWANG